MLFGLGLTCFDPVKTGHIDVAVGGDDQWTAFTVDDKNVYAAQRLNDGGEELVSFSYSPTSKTGGKPTKLVTTNGADQLTTTGDSVLFFETAGLVRVTKSTPATRTVLVAKATGWRLAGDATHAYWLSDSSWPPKAKLLRIALTGGTGVPQHVGGTKVGAFVVDATSIYWAEDGKILRTPK